MNLSPYADLPFDDAQGWKEFLARHELAHQTIAAALQRAGKVANRVPLVGDPRDNPDWLLDHSSMHTSINRQIGLIDVDLLSANLSDETDYLDWMRSHCNVHAAENAALSITT